MVSGTVQAVAKNNLKGSKEVHPHYIEGLYGPLTYADR